MKQETKQLEIGKLLFSKTNPRTLLVKFNMADPDFIDLCSSIEARGVIENILVRPVGKNFEIVNGERRVRACKKLGIKKIKADIRQLSDEETIEIQLIGFDHRQGIHPLAEATAIKALMELKTHSVQTIADRLGKKASYIAQTLQLLNLIDSAKELFAENRITLGHARLISKHQPADQTKILKHLEGSNYRQTAEDLRMWVHTTFMLNLNKAPFKIKDPLLLQDAGSCIDCVKRTGSAPDLFPEVSGSNICTDPACYKKKVDVHIELVQHLAETEGRPLIKVDNTFNNSETKKDVLGKRDYEIYDSRVHKKDEAERAIIVKGDYKGSLVQIVKKKESEPMVSQKKMTAKEIADEENKIIEERREDLLRQQLAADIMKHPDFKKQIFPAIARALLSQYVGYFINEYFFFSDDLDFDSMTNDTIIESFNGGAVAAAARGDSNYPIEFLVECCGFLNVGYKEIKTKIWNDNQLVTVDEIKKRLKNPEQYIADAVNNLAVEYKTKHTDLTIVQIEKLPGYLDEKAAIEERYRG